MINKTVTEIAKRKIYSEKNKIDLQDPIMIVYKISNRCNLTCKYCYFTPSESKKELIVEKFIEFVDFISNQKRGFIYIAFHGGEPLLEKEKIMLIISILLKKRYARRLRFSIQTNATIFSKKMYDYCNNNHIGIGLSIDGNAYETNYNRTYNLNWDEYYNKIMKTINYMQDNKMEFSVISVLNKNNYNNMIDFLKYLISTGVKYWSCNDLVKTCNLKGDVGHLSAKEKLNTYIKIIEFLLSFNKRVKTSERVYETNIASWLRAISNKQNLCYDICSSNPCGLYSHILSIDSDGDLFPCDMVASTMYRITNIKKSNYDVELSDYKNKKKSLDQMCFSNKCALCEANKICKINCKAIMLGSIEIKKELCDLYIPLYKYLENIVNKNEYSYLIPEINVKNL